LTRAHATPGRGQAAIRHEPGCLLGVDGDDKSHPPPPLFLFLFDTQRYELDGMSPPDLRSRVEAEIRSRINLPLWDNARSVEQVEVDSMQEFHKSWQASLCS
jgi:hypothetical protein